MPNSATQQNLTLGDVTFFRFEVPEELPNLFGVQKYAVHDFSGGDRTIQQLGQFPFPEIEWRGIFFNGDAIQSGGLATAIQRASLLNTYRVQGQQQTLVWGHFQYIVFVSEFEITGVLSQELHYRIKVIPQQDLTTSSNSAPSAVNPTQSAFDANTGVLNSLTTPTGLLLPASILGAATTITTSVSNAIIKASGNVTNISSSNQSAIQTQITALQLLLQPLINGSNYGQATGAATLSAALSTLSTMLVPSNYTMVIATINVTNPNLYQLAQQYYKDSTLWPLIAQQNNFQDPYPIGTFTIIIPSTSVQSAFIPSS